jgi:hypothetical protein
VKISDSLKLFVVGYLLLVMVNWSKDKGERERERERTNDSFPALSAV